VTQLRAAPGANFTWSMTDVAGPERPPHTDFRSFLMAVRPLDAPNEDVYLPKIFADIYPEVG